MDLAELGKEFQILWQNIDQDNRILLGELIRAYYDCTAYKYLSISGGERVDKIINKLQEKIGD